MPKNKKSRKAGKMKMPITILAPAAYPAVDAVKAAIDGDFTRGLKILVWRYGGVDDSGFNPQRVAQTYIPVLIGGIVHKGANKFGLNRYIPKWMPINF